MEDAAKWKAQNDKLEYKMNLIKKFGELKEHGLSKAQIAKQFPEMMHLIEDDDDDVDVDA
jgi:phage regulator Rha-like protein